MFKKLQTKHAGFTLVEIMIVVAIIALLAAIAVPGFLRARKRSQASRILNDLRLIDGAVDQYAIETGRTTGFAVDTADWTNYVKKNAILYNTARDILGNDYGPRRSIPCQPCHRPVTMHCRMSPDKDSGRLTDRSPHLFSRRVLRPPKDPLGFKTAVLLRARDHLSPHNKSGVALQSRRAGAPDSS